MTLPLLGAGGSGIQESPSFFASDGAWTWFNDPRAIYDAATNSYLVGYLSKTGFPWVSQYQLDTGYINHARLTTNIFQQDDHANPVEILLNSSGSNPNKILVGYATHDGSSRRRISYLDDKISAMAPEAAAVANRAYTDLVQVNDDNFSVYRFFRDPSLVPSMPRSFAVSTNGGSTFGSKVDMFQITNCRPYPKYYCQPGSSRIDVIMTDSHPAEVIAALGRGNNIYHFYIAVAGDGSRTYHLSDGTLIGDDTDLPLNGGDCTLLYNGSVTNSWVWDLCQVEGVLTAAFATFNPVTGSVISTHYYKIARFVAGSWVVEDVCNAGGTGLDTIYPDSDNDEPAYSGGICLDPNDTNIVYVARKYSNSNVRVEQWRRLSQGNWQKSLDVSGDTGTVNARPCSVQNAPTTQIFYWSGREGAANGGYSSYFVWDTDIYAFPPLTINALPTPIAKPNSPAWQAASAPPGVLEYLAFTNGSGTTVTNFAPGGTNGTFVGSPTWANGTYGPQVGNFSTSNYITIDPASQQLGEGTYPYWALVMFVNSSITDGYLFSQGSSSSSNPFISINVNNANNAGTLRGFARDDSGANSIIPAATSQPTNDGNYHVAMFVVWDANNGSLFLDGSQIANAVGVSSSLGTLTNNRLTVGVLRRNSIATAFGGSAVILVDGRGAVWDPVEAYRDLITGQFSAIRA